MDLNIMPTVAILGTIFGTIIAVVVYVRRRNSA